VRYTVHRAALAVYACHCRECQKQTSSAFALSVPLAVRDLEIEGTLRSYVRATASGSQTDCWFCAGNTSRLAGIER